MSIEHLNAAFKASIKPSAVKFVLVALCDYANEAGIAYPSIETLCNKTGLNRKTVIKHLSALCSSGVLFDTGKRVGKTKSIPKYLINLEAIPKAGLHKEAVPKVDASKPNNGTAKQSQNRDTEPSVSLTTKEPPALSSSSSPAREGFFPLDEEWKPTFNQITERMIDASGIGNQVIDKQLKSFIMHHAIQETTRTQAQWTKAFAHSLMPVLREVSSDSGGNSKEINYDAGVNEDGSF